MTQADSANSTVLPVAATAATATKPVPTRKSTAVSPSAAPEEVANAPAQAAIDAVLTMIRRAAEAGDLPMMERLLAWRDTQMANANEVAFKEAFAAAQAEMASIRADAVNTHANNSRYASLAAMDDAIRRIYTEHGFGLTFDIEDGAPVDSVRLVCDVSHRDGHTRRYHIVMPADGIGARGNPVMTRTHATGSAITYGRRYLIGMIFNLTVLTRDDDGNAANCRPQQSPQPAVPRTNQTTPRFADTAPLALPSQTGQPMDTQPLERFEDALVREFPSPNRTNYQPRRGPMSVAAENIAKDARNAACNGRKAFRAFCTSITKDQYAGAVRPILMELEDLVNKADLEISARLRRTR